MNSYFFSDQLPSSTDLKDRYDQLVLKYPDIDRYLYTTTLNKILSSLDLQEQKELIMALENSEELGKKWLTSRPTLLIVLKENLERNILAAYTQLL
jgi:hypothetical protein